MEAQSDTGAGEEEPSAFRCVATLAGEQLFPARSPTGRTDPPCVAGHTDRVWQVSWAPSGKELASCSGDSTVRIVRSHQLRRAEAMPTKLAHAASAAVAERCRRQLEVRVGPRERASTNDSER